MRSTRWIASFVCAACVAGPSNAQDSSSDLALLSIAPAEQAARDNERLRILQDELKSEQQQVIESTKRRAERLAARDSQGVQEAELAYSRALANVSALQREIASASKQPTGKVAAASGSSPRPRASTAPSSVEAPSQAAWWDVYGKSPRQTAATSITQAATPVSVETPSTGVRAELAR